MRIRLNPDNSPELLVIQDESAGRKTGLLHAPKTYVYDSYIAWLKYSKWVIGI